MRPFGFDNSYARELPGFFVDWQPARAPAPELLYFNATLADDLGLDAALLGGAEGAGFFAGNTLPDDAQPIAQVYAGHQFGGFSPQLGDGRALLVGERLARDGRRRDIAFKGSGRTPYSRGGDGKAALGPMLREVLIGEAMHALGIPTTRALAVAATGERVYRENPLPGAVLTRVAASHLRVGTFQFFAARGEVDKLRQLADYTIRRHDPALVGTPGRYLALLRAVAGRQAELIAMWMNVGFIHGVMNTDNMTISGETIDYGPCAFMEAYDPAAVFSSIDHGGRYAYANQPHIARWNLARLAETLLPLMVDTDDETAAQAAVAQVTAVIDAFPALYATALLRGQRAKLGLEDGAAPTTAADDSEDTAEDSTLAADWLTLLHTQGVDFTLAWRRLADAAGGHDTPLRALFADAAAQRAPQAEPAALDAWLARWQARCQREDAARGSGGSGGSAGSAGSGAPGAPGTSARASRMRRANPLTIPRNHRVEEALAAATAGDLTPFRQLLAVLRRPWDDTPELAPYAEPAPAAVTAGYQTFCGT